MAMAQGTVVFDTHDAFQQLTSAGVPEQQAEAHVRLQARHFESNIVTKTDLETLRTKLRADFANDMTAVKDALSDKIDKNFKWLVATQLGFTTVVIAAIKLV